MQPWPLRLNARRIPIHRCRYRAYRVCVQCFLLDGCVDASFQSTVWHLKSELSFRSSLSKNNSLLASHARVIVDMHAR